MENTRVCLNCTPSFSGNFCNHCGEKVINPADRSLKRLIFQLGELLFNLDNKFLRSIKALTLRPGKLSYHFSFGPRKRFLSPMSIFIILSVLYFLFPVFQTFNSTLNTHLNFGFYSDHAAQMVMEHTKGDEQILNEYTLVFNESTGNYGKMVIFIFVILLTIPMSILNYNQEKYVADHIMTSFEVMAFLILLNALILPCIVYLGFGVGIQGINKESIMGVFLLVFTLYVLIAIHHRYYNNSWWLSIAKSMTLVVVLYFSLHLYRSVVFYVTHWGIT